MVVTSEALISESQTTEYRALSIYWKARNRQYAAELRAVIKAMIMSTS